MALPVNAGVAPVPVVPEPVPAGRDLANEDSLNMGAIQSDLLLGHKKEAETLVFFSIRSLDALAEFLQSLPITAAADVFRVGGVDDAPALLTEISPPNPRFGVAFSMRGLRKLGCDAGPDPLFALLDKGMSGRAVAELNDTDPATWIISDGNDAVDGVLIITGKTRGDVQAALAGPVAAATDHAFGVVRMLDGDTRPGAEKGKEHFGFEDGVSQPAMRGCVDAAHTIPLTANGLGAPIDQGLKGQDLLWPGEFVLGYSTQVGATSKDEKGPPPALTQAWMKDGSFLVIRRLTQRVPEMHGGIAETAPDGGAALLEAQIVGRWPSGAPIKLHPAADDPTVGADENANNAFEFDGDREGLLCPWAAHIRKAYPRNDTPFDLTGQDEAAAEAFTQTHRMMRRGIQFGPEVSQQEAATGTSRDRGLLFKCYVSNIERQFEFVQKSWCNTFDFAQPTAGHDPIIGQVTGGGPRTWFGVGAPGCKAEFSFEPWVQMTGGGYFFAPSLDVIRALTTATPAGAD